MSLALAVLPYVDRRLAHASLVSLDTPDIVPMPWDNTSENDGVTRPWAEAADEVVSGTAEWLVLWSTAIVFGHTGGKDFAAALADDPPCYRSHPGVPRIVSGIGCGWHLTGIHRSVLEIVGGFDACAFFAYYEDTDWIRRHKLSGLGDLWVPDAPWGTVQVEVDIGVNRGDGHTIKSGRVQPNLRVAAAAYIAKWGGYANRERFDHPYDDPTLDHRYVGPPPGD